MKVPWFEIRNSKIRQRHSEMLHLGKLLPYLIEARLKMLAMDEPGNTYRRGWFTTADLLIKVDNIFIIKSS